MKTRLTKLILTLFLLISITSYAQTGKYYSTENGLSSSLINEIYQDKTGFVWIATEYGLNKYDGIHFSVYKHNPEDSTSIKDNYVRKLFEDTKQRFWVGCVNGLMQYDQNTDSFREVKMYKEGRVVFPHVMQLIELANNEIWIATAGHGVFILSPQGENAFYNEELNRELPDPYISALHQDANKNIWIGTENKGLLCYSPYSRHSKKYHTPELTSNQITSIAEDENGVIYIGTLANGVNRLDTKTNSLKPISYKEKNPLNVKHLKLVKGELLVGTDGQGIKVYNKQKENLEDYFINTVPFDLSDGKIHYILEDKGENIWLGVFQKGIILLPKQEGFFHYYGHKSIYHNPIGKGCIMALYKDQKERLWVSADSEGIYELNNNGNRINHYKPQKGENEISATVLSIYEDSESNFWLGFYGTGLAKLNRLTGKCTYIPEFKNQKVYYITEDKEHNLYIATLGFGLYKYNLKDKSVKRIQSVENNLAKERQKEVFNDWINFVLCDKDGLIWIAHYDGISCFNPKTESFIDNPDSRYTLITGSIGYSLLESEQGDIWVGTSNGLYHINKETNQVKHYTTHDGLPNNIICSISEDKLQNIWVSTYMGISKFDTEQKTFINYYAGDGLQGNEFTHGAFFKDKESGTIYMGGTNGVTFFTPQEKKENSIPHNLYVTEFFLFNEPVNQKTLSDGEPIVNSTIIDATHYKLCYKDNTFSIGFSTLQYNNPEQTIYQYRILELNKEWVATDPGSNRVTYNNMQPGKYTFQVRAIVRGEYSQTKIINILITPPWYKTWWAYTLYILLGLWLVVGVINYFRIGYRHKKELLIREHTEEINEMKLQFFINISHEIRTPMTLIINPLEKLLAEVKEKELEKSYQMIYRNAKRILRLINQLMDIRKIDKGLMLMKFRETEMVGFINDLMLTFEYLAKKKDIHFTFQHNKPVLNAWVDVNNFDKVVMNILSNAFKYTPNGGKITVQLSIGENKLYREPLREYIEISITDSGIGIDKEKIEQIFERFYQIDNGVTQSSFGTGIGLHLSRSLVLLHHGILLAENVEGEAGSRFIIRIPKGCSHLKEDDFAENNSEKIYTTAHSTQERHRPIIENEEEKEKRKRGKAKTRLHILVVEDEEEIRNYLEEELRDEYYVTTTVNGKEGYEALLSDTPDLVISDVMMPEMDGITLCKKIKQNVQVNHVPVILLTAKSTPEDKMDGMETGADAYIVKPFHIEVLRTTIANLISNRQLLKSKFSGVQEQKEKVERIQLTSANEQLMDKIMKVVNENIDNPDLNVEMLAAEVGLSRVHVHRKLKELTHLSARDFIKNIRLQQASSLLMEKKLTIAEVAYAVGYSNPSHFSNTFKEMYGCSPKEFMQKHN